MRLEFARVVFFDSAYYTAVQTARMYQAMGPLKTRSMHLYPWQWRETYTPHGIILLDSFGMAGGYGYGQASYMRDVLQYLWWRTGLLYVALQKNGAGMAELHDSAEEAVEAFGIVSSALIISMGNDVFRPATRGVYDELIVTQTIRQAAALKKYVQQHLAPRCLFVYGGSSLTWSYDATAPLGPIYDRYCRAIIGGLLRQGILTTSGRRVLGRLRVVDFIGHVHGEALNVVFEAYVLWARFVSESAPAAKL